MTIEDVLATMQEQLDWRGPSGKPLGHVVLRREAAQMLFVYISTTEGRKSDGRHATQPPG